MSPPDAGSVDWNECKYAARSICLCLSTICLLKSYILTVTQHQKNDTKWPQTVEDVLKETRDKNKSWKIDTE